jgi:molybdate transport system substrate-binding protein
LSKLTTRETKGNSAKMPQLDVACTNGLKGLLLAIGEGTLQKSAGCALSIDFGSTKKLMDEIAGGARPDVMIASEDAINTLASQNKLVGGRIDIARSVVGVAVRKGTPHPDIGSVDAFFQTLKSAPSISRSRLGMSGQHLAKLIEQYGLGAELTPKIKVYDAYAGQACADGEVEIAVQQIAELLPVKGLDIVGPLPDEIQLVTVFSAGVLAQAQEPAAAQALISYLRSKDVAPLIRANGLEPA